MAVIGALVFFILFIGVTEYRRAHSTPPTQENVQDFGAVNAVAGIPYYLYGSGIAATDTSITLTSFKQPVNSYLLSMTDFGDTGYLTLEPGNTTRQEFVSFTGVTQNADGTATLTGVTRGLASVSPFTASSTIRKAHAGGSTAVISNPPQFYERFAVKQNTQYITGAWGFQGTAPTSTVCATSFELCNKAYVDATANAGAATSTETNGGIVELATAAEQAASYAGGANKPTVLQSQYASSTPSSPQSVSANTTIVSDATGYLKQTWLNLTQSFTVSGTWLFSGLASFTATSTTATTTHTGADFNSNITNNLTAGETITASALPVPVMMATSTGNIFVVDGNVASTTNFLGFAINTAAVGGTVYVQTEGVVKGFTGLSPGARYYVSDSVGVLATTPGTAEVYVGQAVSATQILIDRGSFGTWQYLGSQALTSSAATTVNQPYARFAIINATATDSVCENGLTGVITIAKLGNTAGEIRAQCQVTGGADGSSSSYTWSGNTITNAIGGTATAQSATAYYYR